MTNYIEHSVVYYHQHRIEVSHYYNWGCCAVVLDADGNRIHKDDSHRTYDIVLHFAKQAIDNSVATKKGVLI